jgi:predicted ABC-type ATPase
MSGYSSLSKEEVSEISGAYFAKRESKSLAVEIPTIIFIGAQPGAGKSAAAEMIRNELRGQGGYIHVDADRMREQIIIIGDYKPSSQETQADAGKLANALRILAVKGRRNIIEEGTLRNPNTMTTIILSVA